jgi:hypothetical protein
VAQCRGPGPEHEKIAARHQELQREHAQRRDAHERIQKHHESVIARLTALLRAVGEAL